MCYRDCSFAVSHYLSEENVAPAQGGPHGVGGFPNVPVRASVHYYDET